MNREPDDPVPVSEGHRYQYEIEIVWDTINRPGKPVFVPQKEHRLEVRTVDFDALKTYPHLVQGPLIEPHHAARRHTEPGEWDGDPVTFGGTVRIIRIISSVGEQQPSSQSAFRIGIPGFEKLGEGLDD